MRNAAAALLTLVCACAPACGSRDDVRHAGEAYLPESDALTASFPPGVNADDLMPVVDEALKTKGKGPDYTRFVVIRAAERHGVEYRADEFHVVVGGGVTLPAGALRIQRSWGRPGMVDGKNEPPQNYGIAVVVEPGTPRPYAPPVVAAVRAFCEALARRVPIHPDCVVSMGEIPYTRKHEAADDERALAAAARAAVPIPPADKRLVIVTDDRRIEVACEHRRTDVGRYVGLMLRRGFDGEDRGMLFEYPHRAYRNFWMFNCFMPIDLAYIRDGRIEQLLTMTASPDVPSGELRRYASNAAVKFVLEMPAGWFEKNGVEVGNAVEFE
jgi:uncharacterized membrane protein (UPF0127 family)